MLAISPFRALRHEAARFGVALSPAQIDLCERYADLVIARNTSVNLTAITEPEDIAHKHFLDSLTGIAARRWSGRERVVDVGTGAGFPGLALKIALPEIRLTLVDSVAKKTRFLAEVVEGLELDHVTIRNARAEDFAVEARGAFDVGLTRAVGSLGANVEYLLPLLRVGGDAVMWKGRLEADLPGAEKALAAIGGSIVATIATADLGVGDVLPGRHVVVARKLRATPQRFPRRAAEMRRRPW